MLKTLLGRVKKNALTLILGAGIGVGVGWFFTGLRDTMESVLTPSWVQNTLLLIHILFGISISAILKNRSFIEKLIACLGLISSGLLAPLPVALIGIYWIMPVLSDLSLVYSEEVITLISDFAIVLLPLSFISLTTIIFLLIGKGASKLWSLIVKR